MQNQFQPEENQTPQTASLPVAQILPTSETEAEAQASQAAIARLNEITECLNRIKRRSAISDAFLRCLCWAVFIGMQIMVGMRNHYPLPFGIIIILSGLLTPFLNSWYWAQQSPNFDAEEIARLGGVKAILPLFATLEATPSEPMKKAIRRALTALLPQMRASDANRLTPYARATIQGWLQNSLNYTTMREEDYAECLAVLKALEQVGDSSAIPVVAEMAKRKGRTPARMKLQQAAIECLPMLRANCGEVEAARTLLRASQPEATDPDTLLRPASNSADMDTAELLRGSDSPDMPPSEGAA